MTAFWRLGSGGDCPYLAERRHPQLRLGFGYVGKGSDGRAAGGRVLGRRDVGGRLKAGCPRSPTTRSRAPSPLLRNPGFRVLSPKSGAFHSPSTGVIRPDLYEPQYNPVYAAMLAHYGAVADAARVVDPNRKACVSYCLPSRTWDGE